MHLNRILFLALFLSIYTGIFSCQSKDLVLERKNLEFVGQFNKGFSYELLGLGPLLRELRFSQEDLVALAREEIPETATLEDIFVVDVGFVVNPNEEHEAEFIDIQIVEDSASNNYVFSIEDLFVDGELIIDPGQLGLGDDYEEMIQNLNDLFQSGSIDEYVLGLLLDPQQGGAMTDVDIDIIFSIKFSFRACVDVPAGTDAKRCE